MSEDTVTVKVDWLIALAETVDDLAAALDSGDEDEKVAALSQTSVLFGNWPQAVAA